MASSSSAPPASRATPTGWQEFSKTAVNAFHTYANWLVGITWKRFLLLSLLLIIVCGILSDLLTWTVSEMASRSPIVVVRPKVPVPPVPADRHYRVESPQSASDAESGLDISIDEHGLRIRPRSETARAAAAAAASGAASTASGAAADNAVRIGVNARDGLVISVPPGADSETVREAITNAKDEIRQAIDDANEAVHDAGEAAREAAAAADEETRPRTRVVRAGAAFPQLAFLWIVGSMILKITYKGRIQAEVKAAQAVETAEAESLKRQVVEARMAAMQAQVEPHFLFNTLASIDHLIETDPPRASLMQKNLITLLRASMPTMREASDGGARALGRELAVIRPYLEILKVRMEERLTTEIAVPEGLLSAAFPPMMIQTLVENAIKHGLEPKPEGGHLRVSAEVVHGKLAVAVADTGVGFGRAATAGTGVGLANIRERLQLLYGTQATVAVTENLPAGTLITVTIPYRSIEGASA